MFTDARSGLDWWTKRGDTKQYATQLADDTIDTDGQTAITHPDLTGLTITLILAATSLAAGGALPPVYKRQLEVYGDDPTTGEVTFTQDAAFDSACPPGFYRGEIELREGESLVTTYPDNPEHPYLTFRIFPDLGDGPAG